MAKKPTRAQFDELIDQIYSRKHHVIDSMLAENPLLLHGTGNEQNPLGAAARVSDIVTAKKLLALGANPNGHGMLSFTPLHWAASENNRTMFFLLLEHGANPAIVDHAGATPLHTWFSERHIESGFSDVEKISYDDIAALFVTKVSIGQRRLDGKTFLMLACARWCEPEVIDDLVKRGSDLTATNSTGDQALHIAIDNGHFETAMNLFGHGVSIKNVDWRGNSPIHMVQSDSDVNDLLALGADIEAKNYAGDTPLISAVRAVSSSDIYTHVVGALLNKGSDTNAINYDGETPRSLAKKNKLAHVESLFSVFDAKNAMMKVIRSSAKP